MEHLLVFGCGQFWDRGGKLFNPHFDWVADQMAGYALGEQPAIADRTGGVVTRANAGSPGKYAGDVGFEVTGADPDGSLGGDNSELAVIRLRQTADGEDNGIRLVEQFSERQVTTEAGIGPELEPRPLTLILSPGGERRFWSKVPLP